LYVCNCLLDAHLTSPTPFWLIGILDLLTSAALTVYICVCLLQKWGFLSCGAWLLVCSGCYAGVDEMQMDKVIANVNVARCTCF